MGRKEGRKQRKRTIEGKRQTERLTDTQTSKTESVTGVFCTALTVTVEQVPL